MGRSEGYRSNTRDKFTKPFRKNGLPGLAKYLTVYKVGDYVDIKADAAVHKGMPHKYYHGRTGRVWNVGRRALGVVVNKRVRHRIIAKKLCIRLEHLSKSKCRDDFLRRVKENTARQAEAKKNGTGRVNTKRSPGWPKPGKLVKSKKTPQTITPSAYSWVM